MASSAKQVSQAVERRRPELAAAVVARQLAVHPELMQRYGDSGKESCLQDADYHLASLSQAIAMEEPLIFADYVAWVSVMLARRNLPVEGLVCQFDYLREALSESLPAEENAVASRFLATGIDQLSRKPADPPSFLNPETPLKPLGHQYLAALLDGDRQKASRLVLNAIEHGTEIKDIYLEVFEATQHEIGRLWQINQLSIAQEHFCTAATQMIMSQLYPKIFAHEKANGRMVAASVASELHEVGLRMLADFFEMHEWDTYYLGANVPPQGIVQTLIDRNAQVLCLSATMACHLRAVESVIGAVRASPACREVKILVGGYPFNLSPGLWHKMGADGFAKNAQQAVELVGRLL